jgi:hypothetical protein
MKRIAIIFFSIFLVFAFFHFKYILTDGFSPKKIIYYAPYNQETEIHTPLSETCSRILDGEFTYLGKGSQSYVFESQDKNYVIKFIRFHKYRIPFWGQIVRYLNFYPALTKKSLLAKENRHRLVMKSYKHSYEDLSRYTQVEYVHLNQTDFLNKKISIRDKSSIRYQVDLDKVAFIIQKKVSGISDEMEKRIKSGESEKVKNVIDSFVECMVFLSKNNFVNRDYPNLVRNSGCFDEKYIMLDVGSFYHVPDNKKDYLKEQFYNFSGAMRSFLKELGPEYLPFFEERLQKGIACLEF